MTAELNRYPTPYPEVNFLVDQICKNAQQVFGKGLLGFYLDGSLSYDAFDEASDIDFVCVSKEPTSDEQFGALFQFHERLSDLPNKLAIQIEGFYVSAEQLRKSMIPEPLVPNIERGPQEKLKWVSLAPVWDVHRQYLYQAGIVVFGVPAEQLIDPITPAKLRKAMVTWETWLPSLISDPSQVTTRGYQSYIVLTLARILYTIQNGALASKPQAIEWLKQNGNGEWNDLLEDAWHGRMEPDSPITPGMLAVMIKLAKFVLDQAKNNGTEIDDVISESILRG